MGRSLRGNPYRGTPTGKYLQGNSSWGSPVGKSPRDSPVGKSRTNQSPGQLAAATGKASALDRLEREYISSKGVLERGGAEPDVVLGRLAATVAKVIEGLHEEAEGAAAALAERLAKEHKELLTVMKAATNRMVGELVDEAKQGLHTRHNWRAARLRKADSGGTCAWRLAVWAG